MMNRKLKVKRHQTRKKKNAAMTSRIQSTNQTKEIKQKASWPNENQERELDFNLIYGWDL